MAEFRVAIAGAGFWATYQVAAWSELQGVRCVAICDPDRAKAERLAAQAGVARTYDDAAEMIVAERPDLLDIVSDVSSHEALVRLAAENHIPVACQKPLAENWDECVEMVRVCCESPIPFSVHENWRWQEPLRYVKDLLTDNAIGTPFRCRIDMISGSDVLANQPHLRDVRRFIIADLGCHLFDLARSYFGDMNRIYCQTARIGAGIRGENVATALLATRDDSVSVVVEMAYARTPLERECFPQTLLFIEGDCGSIEVAPDYVVHVTDATGTRSLRVPPRHYDWANCDYDVVQASIVACHTDILHAVRTGKPAETDATDNLKSMRLVFAAYESATTGKTVQV